MIILQRGSLLGVPEAQIEIAMNQQPEPAVDHRL